MKYSLTFVSVISLLSFAPAALAGQKTTNNSYQTTNIAGNGNSPSQSNSNNQRPSQAITPTVSGPSPSFGGGGKKGGKGRRDLQSLFARAAEAQKAGGGGGGGAGGQTRKS